MTNAWKYVSIEEIAASTANALAMGPFGSNIKSDNFVPTGVPVIRGINLSNGRFHSDGFVFITEEKADELKSANVFPEDIVFTHRGTLGQVGIIPRDSKYPRYVISQSQMKLTCDKEKAVPLYVYYFFHSPQGQNALLSNTSTTGVPAIARPLSSLKQITIPLPSIDEQIAISSFFGAFDDRIELNHAINNILQKICRLIFVHWFIDFEFPDIAGKPYKSSGGKMIDSKLGKIPRGWKTGTLYDLCEITMGQSPPGDSYNKSGEGISFFQGARDFGFRFPSRRVFCTSPKRFAKQNDVLLSVRAPIGTLNIANEYCCIGRGLASLRLKNAENNYLYYFLLEQQVEWEKFEAGGTVFGAITREDINEFNIVIPPHEILKKFTEIVQPLDNMIETNANLTIVLSTIRDIHLPKIFSEKLKINYLQSKTKT